MSALIILFPAPSDHNPSTTVTTSHFGGCPHCGNANGYLNDGPDHWFFCHRHKTKWHKDSNLFSGWRDEDEEVWRLNRFRLAEYMTVSPIHVGLS